MPTFSCYMVFIMTDIITQSLRQWTKSQNSWLLRVIWVIYPFFVLGSVRVQSLYASIFSFESRNNLEVDMFVFRILSHSAVEEQINVSILSHMKFCYVKICVYQELGQT